MLCAGCFHYWHIGATNLCDKSFLTLILVILQELEKLRSKCDRRCGGERRLPGRQWRSPCCQGVVCRLSVCICWVFVLVCCFYADNLIEPLLKCLSLPGFKWQVHPGGGGQLRHWLWQCVSRSNCAEFFIQFSETDRESSQEWNVLSTGFQKSKRRFLIQIQLLGFLNKYALGTRSQEKLD